LCRRPRLREKARSDRAETNTGHDGSDDTFALGHPEKPGPHHVEGIGVGFWPPLLTREAVKEEDARQNARRLATEVGILAGISGGKLYSTPEFSHNLFKFS
jgi:cysteine synthase